MVEGYTLFHPRSPPRGGFCGGRQRARRPRSGRPGQRAEAGAGQGRGAEAAGFWTSCRCRWLGGAAAAPSGRHRRPEGQFVWEPPLCVVGGSFVLEVRICCVLFACCSTQHNVTTLDVEASKKIFTHSRSAAGGALSVDNGMLKPGTREVHPSLCVYLHNQSIRTVSNLSSKEVRIPAFPGVAAALLPLSTTR